VLISSRKVDEVVPGRNRLGELLLARMKRNSRSALAEVWDAESGFAEPDAELVGHLIRHRKELAYWMRAVLDGVLQGAYGLAFHIR
jgi:hypothetical protein